MGRFSQESRAYMQSEMNKFGETGALVLELPRSIVPSRSNVVSRAALLKNAQEVDAWAQHLFSLDTASKDTLTCELEDGYARCARKEMFHVRAKEKPEHNRAVKNALDIPVLKKNMMKDKSSGGGYASNTKSVDSQQGRDFQAELLDMESVVVRDAYGQLAPHAISNGTPHAASVAFQHFQTMAENFVLGLSRSLKGSDETVTNFLETVASPGYSSHSSCLTIFNYYEQAVTVDHCPPHTDRGVLTLILNMATGADQIEVETINGQWTRPECESIQCRKQGQCPNGHVLQRLELPATRSLQRKAMLGCEHGDAECCECKEDFGVEDVLVCATCNFVSCLACCESDTPCIMILSGRTLDVATGGRCRAAVHRVINDGRPRRSLVFKFRAPTEITLPHSCSTVGQLLAEFALTNPSVNASVDTAGASRSLLALPGRAARFVVSHALARAREVDVESMHVGWMRAMLGPKAARLLKILQLLECRDIAICGMACWRFQEATESEILWIRPCLLLGVDWVQKTDADTWSAYYGREFLRARQWSHPITVGFLMKGNVEHCVITKATRVQRMQQIYTMLARRCECSDFSADLFILNKRVGADKITIYDSGKSADINPMAGDLGIEEGDIFDNESAVREGIMKRSMGD